MRRPGRVGGLGRTGAPARAALTRSRAGPAGRACDRFPQRGIGNGSLLPPPGGLAPQLNASGGHAAPGADRAPERAQNGLRGLEYPRHVNGQIQGPRSVREREPYSPRRRRAPGEIADHRHGAHGVGSPRAPTRPPHWRVFFFHRGRREVSDRPSSTAGSSPGRRRRDVRRSPRPSARAAAPSPTYRSSPFFARFLGLDGLLGLITGSRRENGGTRRDER